MCVRLLVYVVARASPATESGTEGTQGSVRKQTWSLAWPLGNVEVRALSEARYRRVDSNGDVRSEQEEVTDREQSRWATARKDDIAAVNGDVEVTFRWQVRSREKVS